MRATRLTGRVALVLICYNTGMEHSPTSATGTGSEVWAFIREHQRCGELDTGLDSELFQLTCSCGAALVRVVALG